MKLTLGELRSLINEVVLAGDFDHDKFFAIWYGSPGVDPHGSILPDDPETYVGMKPPHDDAQSDTEEDVTDNSQ